MLKGQTDLFTENYLEKIGITDFWGNMEREQ